VEPARSRVALGKVLEGPGSSLFKQLEDNLAASAVKLSPQHLEKLNKISEPIWAYPYDFIGMREPW